MGEVGFQVGRVANTFQLLDPKFGEQKRSKEKMRKHGKPWQQVMQRKMPIAI